MIYYKEGCKELASAGAAILLLDGHMENGTPIFVTRKVVGTHGVKFGRDSKWVVKLDSPLSDDATGLYPAFILGINMGDGMDITPLVDLVHKKYSFLSIQERMMLISDARVRLKEAKS
ncbi:MAG: hypothetical protein LBS05_09510 [Tannerellaceae bacterium]|jgi:hypothetical protein|nr:hypothetical protein [Tannerellaceae bacterium]